MERQMDTLVRPAAEQRQEEVTMKSYKGTATLAVSDASGQSEVVGRFTFQVIADVPAGESPEVVASDILLKHIRQSGSLRVEQVVEVPAEQAVAAIRPV